ncbi:hypothetical protein ACFL5A_00975 [Gemmatimonadota bacterium]
MASVGSRRGSVEKLSLPLMIVAFLVVGGFLWWLNKAAVPTEVAIEEEVAERVSGAAAILDLTDFLEDPGQWVDQIVEVTAARVTSRLGAQAFWIGPSDGPFLVKLSPALLESGQEILVEQVVNLTGTVHLMSDSALVVWDEAGAFPAEGDRFVAEFAVGSPFLEVTEFQAVPAPGGMGSGS